VDQVHALRERAVLISSSYSI